MMMPETQKINLIKYLRKNKLTNTIIADRAGISISQFSAFTCGTLRLPDKYYTALAKALPIVKSEAKKGKFVFKKGV